MIHLDRVIDALTSSRFPFGTEVELHEAIETVLRAREIPYQREAILGPKDRPDFLVGAEDEARWVIEAKVGRSWSRMGVYRQCSRYAKNFGVAGIILVSPGRYVVPNEIGGKPVRVISLGTAWL